MSTGPHSSLAAQLAMVCAGASLVALTVVACSSNRDNFSENEGPFTGPDSSVPDAPSCGFSCSRDLKKVLKGCDDRANEVIETCGPDQGCGVDKCVDACQSAEISKGSVGCSFWAVPPDDSNYGAGACYAAMIANTWDRPVTLDAEYGKDPLDISKSVYTVTRDGAGEPVYTLLTGALPPGQVGIVFLAQADHPLDPEATRCPAGTKPALNIDPLRHGTAKTSAFHLKADAPVAAYAIFPYGGAASMYPAATLLLPVSSWDKSYIAVSTGKFGDTQAASLDRRTLQIIANEDDTEVSMRPVVDIVSGENVTPGFAGEPTIWSLMKGQVLQITQSRTTTGSPILANKPVGMFGGSPCAFIPASTPYCDLTQQQIAPFSQWGTEYALVPFLPRVQAVTGTARETVPWSFVGAVDGTVLTYEPAKPPGAPETLDAGQAVSFMTDALVTVKSQDKKHPFHAGVHMTGARFGGGSPGGGTTGGDPEFVNVAPSDQFLDRYVFFTDYTYPETSLTIVRRKTPAGFLPVDLECAGEVTGFLPLGSSGQYEYTYVRLTTGFVPQKFTKGTCGYGRHLAQSDGPFSVTVWGTGKDASYGYVGGVGSRPINEAPAPIVK